MGTAQKEHRQQRHDGEREEQRPDQGRDDRVGHWGEYPAFVPLEREDRKVRKNDDLHREDGRATDFDGRVEDDRLGFPAVIRPFRQVPEDVLHDDHGAVDDDPEVHGAERQQVGGDPADSEPDERRQKRERNDGGHDTGRAQVAQEEIEHDRHQNRAFEQVLEHRVQRRLDQLRPVVERHDLRRLRQDGAIQRGDARLDGGQHLRRVLALSHQDDAGDRLVLVVHADEPLARHAAHSDLGDVPNQQRSSRVGRHDDVADVVGRAQHADAANEVLLLAALEEAAARIGVASSEGREHLLERDVVGLHPRGVHGHVVSLDEAAEADDIGDARNHPEIPRDHPVLNASELGGALALSRHAIPVDLPDRRGQRGELGLYAGREVGALKTLEDLLAREVVGRVVVEGQDDV